MQSNLTASIWADPAPSPSSSRKENVAPRTSTIMASTPSMKIFSSGTPSAAAPAPVSSSTSSTPASAIDASSATARPRTTALYRQASDRSASPALSVASSSTRTEASSNPDPKVPRGPALFNPQQAALLRNDPESRFTTAKPSRNRGPAVSRPPANGSPFLVPSPAPRQSLVARQSIAPGRTAAPPTVNGSSGRPQFAQQEPAQGRDAQTASGSSQWGRFAQQEQARDRAGQSYTSVTLAAAREEINKQNASLQAKLDERTVEAPSTWSNTRDLASIDFGGQSNATSTAGHLMGATKGSAGIQATTAAAKPSIIDAAKARMLAASQAMDAKTATPAAKSSPAPVSVFASAALSSASNPAAATAAPAPGTRDTKPVATKATAVEKQHDAKESQLPAASGTIPEMTAPHLRAAAEATKQSKPESKVEIKPLPEVKIKTEPKEEDVPAAPKPTDVLRLAAMLTPAASPGNVDYADRMMRYTSLAMTNPAQAALKLDLLQEQNAILEEMMEITLEKQELVTTREEALKRIDAKIAAKNEMYERCIKSLAAMKQMQKDEKELAAEESAKPNGWMQQE